ncbi:hypothetical protein BVY03_02925 [bacterium K02(2017)]|nr:hypothetical protein BVY03_02925 [bacterium K02(2017)]
MNQAYIIDAVRTPRAKRKGSFSDIHPIDLLTHPLKSIIQRQKIESSCIDDVIMGCALQHHEQDNIIARKAILAAGLPESIPGVTLNRFCGSGLTACNWASQSIMSGMQEIVIAGGIEHMTRVPMNIDFYNGDSQLNLKYPNLVSQGESAEMVATKYQFERKQIDEFALRSQQLANQAWVENRFKNSIIPVNNLTSDEHMRPQTTIETLTNLKPVFKSNGVITAGNASGIVDGAASVLFASQQAVNKHQLTPRARVMATATVGSDPVIMLLGPTAAINKALKIAQLELNDIDLFEINEAFAPVPMAIAKDLKINLDKINVNGGSIALGHPLGATGAILLGTILDELERQNKQYGLVTLCTGYGMAVAMIIDRNV